MSVSSPLSLHEGDRPRLEAMARSTVPTGLATRARIVLLAAEGLANAEIARQTSTTRPTVLSWRNRYQSGGFDALHDQPRSGRPRQVDEIDVVVATLADGGRPPEHLAVPHWSARLLGRELGIGFSTIARIWRRWGIQPDRVQTFAFSTDPELEATVRDVVGLYLNPPERAIVLYVEERSQVETLGPTTPMLPLLPTPPLRAAPDYGRHGTPALFAALDVATSKIVDACYPWHRHHVFLTFLRRVAMAHPRVPLHIVCDNGEAQLHPRVRAWLDRNPRIRLHSTPTSLSWLSMVGICFGLITRQAAVHPGTVRSVADLIDAIQIFIDGWNQRCAPFVWTKDADTILARHNRKATSSTPH